jgi:arylsulfatase A-like enzyme
VYNIDIDDQSETFQLAVRQGAWKLIWGQTKEFKPNKKEEPELLLFNLEQDPNERRNLADREEERVLKLQQLAMKLAKV